jgi:hypothetical protein
VPRASRPLAGVSDRDGDVSFSSYTLINLRYHIPPNPGAMEGNTKKQAARYVCTSAGPELDAEFWLCFKAK